MRARIWESTERNRVSKSLLRFFRFDVYDVSHDNINFSLTSSQGLKIGTLPFELEVSPSLLLIILPTLLIKS